VSVGRLQDRHQQRGPAVWSCPDRRPALRCKDDDRPWCSPRGRRPQPRPDVCRRSEDGTTSRWRPLIGVLRGDADGAGITPAAGDRGGSGTERSTVRSVHSQTSGGQPRDHGL